MRHAYVQDRPDDGLRSLVADTPGPTAHLSDLAPWRRVGI
jgi:hypothetical protein